MARSRGAARRAHGQVDDGAPSLGDDPCCVGLAPSAWLERHPSWGDSEHRDLLLHLVVSHHGNGRPLVTPVDDGTAAKVSAVVDGMPVEAPADLARVDWGQPRRFRKLNDRYGPWGLALLEAIVRIADWRVSAGVDVSRGTAR